MNGLSIFLLCICIPLCIFIIFSTVSFILYHKYPNKKFLRKIYHDILDYHLPDYNYIKELNDNESIQFVAYCRVCKKPIYMPRRKAKKWKIIDSLDEINTSVAANLKKD